MNHDRPRRSHVEKLVTESRHHCALGRQLIGSPFLQMFEVLDAQLRGITGGVIEWDDVVIAYEPVWAIGTGKAGAC